MIRPDKEALMVALVLAPATYSRNRFFDLYADPEVRLMRRRASVIRSAVRQLASTTAQRAEVTKIELLENGATSITFEIAALGLKRTTRLSAIELSTLRVALGRGGTGPAELRPTPEDR